MTIHTVLPMVCCAVGLGAALGCTNAPATPSRPSPMPISAATSTTGSSTATASTTRFGDRTPGVVFVTSQGLYYDTFVVKDPLPMKGQFQLLTAGQTEFGPGQPGYLGGRWWQDLNNDGIQDAGDHYFLCPLLPPGRPTP